MKKVIAILLTILMLFSLFQGALGENVVKANNQPVSEELDLFYTVTIEQGREYVGVKINVTNLSHNSFNIGFYNATADIHTYVRNLEVNAGGVKVDLKYVSVNTWSIQLQNAVSSLNIYYEISKIVPCNNIFVGRATGSELAVIIVDDGGILAGQNFFIVPIDLKAKKIAVKFNLPEGWQIVCPYIDRGDYFEVPKITNNLVGNFVQRKGIYFGKMKFYSEKQVDNCVVKFGVLEADSSFSTETLLAKQEDVDFHVQRTALAVEKFTEIFGENPYPVETIYTYFSAKDKAGNDLIFDGYGVTGTLQYWPRDRYDELTGHLLYNWFCFPNKDESLICSIDLLGKGLGESYLGCKMAYELTGDKVYLGKFYYYYLVYKRAINTKYMSGEEIRNRYYRGAVIGLYLDYLIQNETKNSKSIYDVFRYLYNKYKNTEHCINIQDLEEAVNAITGKNHSIIFNKYIYGDEEMPVKDIIQPYKESFDAFLKVIDYNFPKEYHGYAIPFFIDLEISIPTYVAMPSSHHLPFEILIKKYYRDFAKYVLKNYDIGTLTKKDVEDTLSKLTGEDCTGFFERWKDCYRELTIEELKDWLKSYLPYTPQNVTAEFKNNSVSIHWNLVDWKYPSGYYEITGYAIYRGTSPGEEALIMAVDANISTYTDKNITVGETYYYYIKSIENLYQEIPVYSDPSSEVIVICKDTTPPEIFIYSPEDNLKTNENTVTVSGTILDKESGIDKVTVNGNAVSLAFDGSFGTTIMLSEGINSITVVATDKTGNQTTKTLDVTYKKPVQQTVIILQIGNMTYTVNGSTRTLDSPPIIKNNRTLLPIRAIIEALGGTVGWDPNEKKVTVTLGSITIELWIGKNTAKVNGVDTPIDSTNSKVVPEIINSRTMLPLRFVTENLSCDVQWDGTTKTITITY